MNFNEIKTNEMKISKPNLNRTCINMTFKFYSQLLPFEYVQLSIKRNVLHNNRTLVYYDALYWVTDVLEIQHVCDTILDVLLCLQN